MVRYNLYDLLEPKSKERLDFITARINFHFEEKELRRVNLTREAVQALGAFIKDHSGKGVELKRSPNQSLTPDKKRTSENHENIDDPFDEEKIKQNNKTFNNYIKLRRLMKLFIDQEMAIYWSNQERIKKIDEEIKELVKKEIEARNENNAEAMRELNDQKQRFVMDRLNQLIQQKGDLLKKAEELKQAERELTNNIQKLKEVKKEVLEKHAIATTKKLNDFVAPDNKNYLAKINDKQKQDFITNIIKENHKIDKKISTTDKRIHELEKENMILLEEDKKLLERMAKGRTVVNHDKTYTNVVAPMFGAKKDVATNPGIQKNAEMRANNKLLIKELKKEKTFWETQRADQEKIYRNAAEKAGLHEFAQADKEVVDAAINHLSSSIEAGVETQNQISENRRELKAGREEVRKDLKSCVEELKSCSQKVEKELKMLGTQHHIMEISEQKTAVDFNSTNDQLDNDLELLLADLNVDPSEEQERNNTNSAKPPF